MFCQICEVIQTGLQMGKWTGNKKKKELPGVMSGNPEYLKIYEVNSLKTCLTRLSKLMGSHRAINFNPYFPVKV